jgi:hypothetical protein
MNEIGFIPELKGYVRPVNEEDRKIWPSLKDEKFILCQSHGKNVLTLKGDYSKYCAICGGKL